MKEVEEYVGLGEVHKSLHSALDDFLDDSLDDVFTGNADWDDPLGAASDASDDPFASEVPEALARLEAHPVHALPRRSEIIESVRKLRMSFSPIC